MTSNSARALASRPSLVSDMPDHEADEHRGIQEAPLPSGRLISGEEARNALTYLKRSAAEFGMAVRRAKRAEALMSSTEARLTRDSTAKLPTDRKMEARAHQDWIDAAEEEAAADGDLAEIRALREAAEQICRLYQTQQADSRELK